MINNKEKIDIIDISYLRQVNYEELLEHSNKIFVLNENLKDYFTHEDKYRITKSQIIELLNNNTLNVYHLSSKYSDVSTHDIFIYFATMLKFEYDVTVYTCDDTIIVDLLLLNIKVKSINYKYSNKFNNLGNDNTNDIIYIYDTSYIITNLFKIDFSNNKHILLSCVLEELIFNDPQNISSTLYAIIYLIDIYPDNFEIINTASYTQKGGRYSYTDLLILISSLNILNSEKYKNKHIVFKTLDNKLLTDAICSNKINVSVDNDGIPLKKSNILTLTQITDTLTLSNICTNSEKISNFSKDTKYISSITENFTKLNIIKIFEQAALEISDIIVGIYKYDLTPAEKIPKFIMKQFASKNAIYWIKKGYFIKLINNKFYEIKKIEENIAIIEEI